jgi:hypothetical protein
MFGHIGHPLNEWEMDVCSSFDTSIWHRVAVRFPEKREGRLGRQGRTGDFYKLGIFGTRRMEDGGRNKKRLVCCGKEERVS